MDAREVRAKALMLRAIQDYDTQYAEIDGVGHAGGIFVRRHEDEPITKAPELPGYFMHIYPATPNGNVESVVVTFVDGEFYVVDRTGWMIVGELP